MGLGVDAPDGGVGFSGADFAQFSRASAASLVGVPPELNPGSVGITTSPGFSGALEVPTNLSQGVSRDTQAVLNGGFGSTITPSPSSVRPPITPDFIDNAPDDSGLAAPKIAVAPKIAAAPKVTDVPKITDTKRPTRRGAGRVSRFSASSRRSLLSGSRGLLNPANTTRKTLLGL